MICSFVAKNGLFLGDSCWLYGEVGILLWFICITAGSINRTPVHFWLLRTCRDGCNKYMLSISKFSINQVQGMQPIRYASRDVSGTEAGPSQLIKPSLHFGILGLASLLGKIKLATSCKFAMAYHMSYGLIGLGLFVI